MAKVIAHVYVLKDGYPVLLSPGDTIPEGVEVTNPAVLDESEADASEDDAPEDDAPEDKAPAKRAPRKAAASE